MLPTALPTLLPALLIALPKPDKPPFFGGVAAGNTPGVVGGAAGSVGVANVAGKSPVIPGASVATGELPTIF